MNYDSTLQWLQNLLGNSQNLYATQFGQGLSAEQGALASRLAEQGRESDAQLALQRVIADWQNQLANKQFGLQSDAQKFAQEQAQLQESLPYQAQESYFSNLASPTTQAANNTFLTNFMSRYNPYSSTYAYGVPMGSGNSVNPYTGITLSRTGIPIISATPPTTATRSTGY